MDVLVYSGPGAGERSLQQAISELGDLLDPKFKIKKTNFDVINDGNWINTTALLVMPGGADLPYVSKLSGQGIAHIKKFVENGGTYLGFCAGAYFGAQEIEFEKGGKLEVLGKRELGFYKGKAIGPAYGPGFCYENSSSAKAAKLRLHSGELVLTYYEGGCCFCGDDSVEIIAHYADLPGHPAAIVRIKIGAGKAVLCGVHPEFSSQVCMSFRTDLAQELKPFEESRKKLLASLIAGL